MPGGIEPARQRLSLRVMTDRTPIKDLIDTTYRLYKKQAKLDAKQIKSLDSALLRSKKKELSEKREISCYDNEKKTFYENLRKFQKEKVEERKMLRLKEHQRRQSNRNASAMYTEKKSQSNAAEGSQIYSSSHSGENKMWLPQIPTRQHQVPLKRVSTKSITTTPTEIENPKIGKELKSKYIKKLEQQHYSSHNDEGQTNDQSDLGVPRE